MNKSGNKLDQFLTSNGLINKLQNVPTTNGMTQIDICYSNISELSATCFESYFSYHKPIVCVIDKGVPNTLKTNQFEEKVIISSKKVTPTDQYLTPNLQTDVEEIREPEENVFFKGFQNNDNVSCYANVVCQCILFIAPLHDAVMVADNDIITNLMLSYIDPKQNTLSSWGIRQLVDLENRIENFTLPLQQDVPEFIDYLKNVFPVFDEITKHELCYEFHCANCPNTFKDNNVTKNTILPVYTVCNTTSLKSMIKESYDVWKTIDRECHGCGSNVMMTKTSVGVQTQCSVIFLQLMIFEHNGIETVKKPRVLHNLQSEIIEICDVRFEVCGIISHHGSDISSGHYTCKMKSGDSWYYANDNVVNKCSIPTVETDSYVIVLKKCENN